jgi:hypothetical protein
LPNQNDIPSIPLDQQGPLPPTPENPIMQNNLSQRKGLRSAFIYSQASCDELICFNFNAAGDCAGIANVPGRNLFFDDVLEVTPCLYEKIVKCWPFKNGTISDCSTQSLDPNTVPYEIRVAVNPLTPTITIKGYFVNLYLRESISYHLIDF